MRIHWPRVSQDSLAYTATLVASTLSQHETRFFSDNVLDDAWKFLVALALLVGSWIGGVYLEVILWHIGMFNWKRLFNMDPKNGPWWTSFYDEKESMNHPQHLPDLQSNNNNNRSMPAWPPAQTVIPVMSGLHQRNVPVFPVTTIGNNDAPAPSPSAAAAAAQGVPFKTVQVMRLNDYNRWYQHLPRNRFENNVRLIAAFGRIIAVCTGFLFAFDSAGINIFSMLASVGILALCFSYGAGSLLGNYFAYVMTLIANKTKRHEWISYAGYQGFVSAMGGNNMELTNDLDPWKGRQTIQIPNKTQVDGVIVIYRDGPPPELIKSYFEKLSEVNAWRTTIGMAPLEQSVEATVIASKFAERFCI